MATRCSTPVYLDNHATTPVDPRVCAAMMESLEHHFGNPSNPQHVFARRAEEAQERARATIAAWLGAKSSQEVLITSGATESNNLAIKGVVEGCAVGKTAHLITSKVEHPSVLATCRYLERCGHQVTYLDVDAFGVVDPEQVRRSLRPETCLISVMLCNHEVGSVQPIAAIAAIAREHGALMHCDAVQGIGRVPFDVEAMQVDFATLSGHKVYGPKGIGVLYVRRGVAAVKLAAQLHGGSQEQGLRSGTVNVPGLVGLAKAAALFAEEGEAENARLRVLRDRLQAYLLGHLDDVQLHGADAERRHPGNLNVSFGFVKAADLIWEMQDIAVSAGSACGGGKASPVLDAMGVPEERAVAALRFGVGRFNTTAEIDYVGERVVETVRHLRSQSPRYAAARGSVSSVAAKAAGSAVAEPAAAASTAVVW